MGQGGVEVADKSTRYSYGDGVSTVMGMKGIQEFLDEAIREARGNPY